MRNCTRDEGGPFEFGNQVPISSHRRRGFLGVESNLERCKAECAAIDREMKTLPAEGPADNDGRAAQRRRLAELETRRGAAIRKMLAADRAIINARWSRPAH